MASLCESVLFLFHEGPSPACSHPKLSIFERGAEQNFDLNNNFWLDFLTARDQEQGLFTTIFTTIFTRQGIWDLNS